MNCLLKRYTTKLARLPLKFQKAKTTENIPLQNSPSYSPDSSPDISFHTLNRA